MSALLRKELRALRPLAALLGAVFVLSLAFLLGTEFADQQPFTVEKLKENESGRIVIALLFATLIGAGLLLREREEGTLSFLDGLPVSRSRIFLAKAAAGMLVLSLLPALDFGSEIIFGALTRSSVDPGLPWAHASAMFGLNFLTLFYGLALALALSFLRQWFAFAVGFAVWGVLWLYANDASWIEFVDPFSLVPESHGGAVLIPWKHAGAQVGLAFAALAFAWGAFHQLGARSQDLADHFRRRRLGRWIFALAGIATPAIWIAAFFLMAETFSPDDSPDFDQKPLGEDAFARIETARYEFLLRESQREDAQSLIDAADDVHGTVVGDLGTPPARERIIVDLASPIVPHAAGQTNWTKVRLPLRPGQELEERRLILAHETAHVFAHRLSENALDDIYNSVRFFNEGLATHIERNFTSDNGMNRLAAASGARGKIPFALLCDDAQMAKTRHAELAYPFGMIFCRALIQTCGKDAPARLLRAFYERDRFTGHSGTALWRDVMQRCGFFLDHTVAAYDAEVARLEQAEAEFVRSLPRIMGTVEVAADEVVIRPRFEGKAPGALVCIVPDPAMLGASDVIRHTGNDGTVRFPRRMFPGRTARYALGWAVEDLRLPIFEPWVEVGL